MPGAPPPPPPCQPTGAEGLVPPSTGSGCARLRAALTHHSHQCSHGSGLRSPKNQAWTELVSPRGPRETPSCPPTFQRRPLPGLQPLLCPHHQQHRVCPFLGLPPASLLGGYPGPQGHPTSGPRPRSPLPWEATHPSSRHQDRDVFGAVIPPATQVSSITLPSCLLRATWDCCTGYVQGTQPRCRSLGSPVTPPPPARPRFFADRPHPLGAVPGLRPSHGGTSPCGLGVGAQDAPSTVTREASPRHSDVPSQRASLWVCPPHSPLSPSSARA